MKIAIYNPGFNRELWTLEVLKENKDGTLDLGREGVPVVTSCPISEDGAIGHCVLADTAAAKKIADEKDAQAKAAAELAKNAEKVK